MDNRVAFHRLKRRRRAFPGARTIANAITVHMHTLGFAVLFAFVTVLSCCCGQQSGAWHPPVGYKLPPLLNDAALAPEIAATLGNGICATCTKTHIPMSICPVGYTSADVNSPNYPECEPCPSGKTCPVEGDRVPALPCPDGHYCPPGLNTSPLLCPSGYVCTATRAYMVWGPLVWLGVLASLVLLVLVFRRRTRRAGALLNASGGSAGSASSSSGSGSGNGMRLHVALDSVSYVAGKRAILSSVTGRLGHGSMTIVLGPSGAGKTTLLQMLRGSISPSSGRVLVNGRATSLARHRSLVGYVPQSDDTMDPLLSVEQQLLMHALVRRPGLPASLSAVRASVRELLSELGIEHVRHSLVSSGRDEARRTLSGGERRRVNVGVELATNPDYLLLDEVTSGLDSLAATAMIRTLRSLCQQRGASVVATIHQPSQSLFDLFDEVLILARGKVVFWGSVAQAEATFQAWGMPVAARRDKTLPDSILDWVTEHQDDDTPPWRGSGASSAAGSAEPSTTSWDESRVAAAEAALPHVPLVRRVSRGVARLCLQTAVQLWRACVRALHSVSSLVAYYLLFSACGLVLGLVFSQPKYRMPLPERLAAACPAAMNMLTYEEWRNRPCASNFPLSDSTGLMALYAAIMVGILSVAYSVNSFGSFRPSYWRETSAGFASFPYYASVVLVDGVAAMLLAFAFLTPYFLLANPWGAFSDYWSATSAFVFAMFGVGYIMSALFSKKLASIAACLVAIALGQTSGLPFKEQANWVFPFFFGQALYVSELSVLLDRANDMIIAIVDEYAKLQTAYKVSSKVGEDVGRIIAWAVALQLAGYACLRLRYRRKQS